MIRAGDPADRRAVFRAVACSAAAFIGVLALVLPTVAPGVTFGDSGELLSSAVTLGIAHAPGYPLWTMLAHVAMKTLPTGDPALAVNLFSALCLAVAAVLAFAAFRDLCGDDAVALACSWALCLSPVVWDVGTTAEVYAFDLMLLAAGLALVLLLHRRMTAGSSLAGWQALVLGLVLGAGLAHRPSHLPMQVGYLVLLLGVPRGRWLRAGPMVALAGGYALSLCVLLYLPIRGGMFPGLPWGIGGPARYRWAFMTDWKAVLDHVSAKVYGPYVWGARPRLWPAMVSSDVVKWRHELSAPVWLASAIGLVAGWRRVGVRLAAVVGIACANLLLFWNYFTCDQEVFFIPLYLGLCGLAAVGLCAVGERWGGRGAFAMAAVLVVVTAWKVPQTFREVDRSREAFAGEYARRVLSLVGDDADVIFEDKHGVGDHRLFPIYYYQHAYGLAPRTRTWLTPASENGTWVVCLEFLGAPRDQIGSAAEIRADDRWRVMARLAVRRGRVFCGGSDWAVRGGAYLQSAGWVTLVRGDPNPAPGDPHVIEECLDWLKRCDGLRPEDAAFADMSTVPALEVVDELISYRRFDQAQALLDRILEVVPDDWPRSRPRVLLEMLDLEAAKGNSLQAATRYEPWAGRQRDLWTRMLLERKLGRLFHTGGDDHSAARHLEIGLAFRGSEGMVDEQRMLAGCYRELGSGHGSGG